MHMGYTLLSQLHAWSISSTSAGLLSCGAGTHAIIVVITNTHLALHLARIVQCCIRTSSLAINIGAGLLLAIGTDQKH